MITVTNNAKEWLKELLLTRIRDPEFSVRLVLDESEQARLVVGREAPGDYVVEHDGSKVLLVAQDMAERVGELTLDVKDTPEGVKLVISKA